MRVTVSIQKTSAGSSIIIIYNNTLLESFFPTAVYKSLLWSVDSVLLL